MRGTKALLLLVASGLATSADAAQVTVGASQDNTVFSESGMLSNGAGQHFFCGQTDQGHTRRALVRFDVAAAIPSGSTITGAQLTLYLSRTKTNNLSVALYRVLSSWGESSSDASGEEGAGALAAVGDATWTHRFYNTDVWVSAGGDSASTASASAMVANQIGYYSWSSSGMIADVQAWLDTPSNNFGWALLASTNGNKQTKRFDSRQHGDVTRRPQLVVTFDPPSNSGACCDSTGSCTVVVHPGSSCVGSYQGAGSVCSPNPCPQPTGACCLADAEATCLQESALGCAAAGGTFQGVGDSCAPNPCAVVPTPFVDPLPIPAIAQPTSGRAGAAANYRIAIKQLRQQLHSELPPSTVWGFDDGQTASYPGPTIEAASGAPITITWVNDLRDEHNHLLTSHHLQVDTCVHGAADASPRTVMHLHGGHVPQDSDGYPEWTWLPGEQVDYAYPNAQDAATLWYHDHALGITRLNVYMGLAGFYLVRNDDEAALGLPAGEHEVPLVIQDRRVAADGSLIYPGAWQEHFFGDLILVNGRVWPYLEVKQGKYRFRVLNGSNARVYRLTLSNGASFEQIGSDGGLLPAPVPREQLLLTPGERADVVIDFASYPPGTEILLVNDAPAPYPDASNQGVVSDVMKLVVIAQPGHTEPLPATLRTIERLDEKDAVTSRDFVLAKGDDACTGSTWLINGMGWDDITENPRLGTSEIWRFINPSGVAHPMHMHLVFFQVLDRQPFDMVNGTPVPIGSAVSPSAEEAGWKDTVRVEPNEMLRVIARFEDYVGKYAYHCHLLEHEDHGMMRQFETVTSCGDGAVGMPLEECDDGNQLDRDGCSASCRLEGSTGGAGGEPASGGGASAAPDAENASCGCRHPKPGAPANPAWLLLALVALARHRRRCRRSRGHSTYAF